MKKAALIVITVVLFLAFFKAGAAIAQGADPVAGDPSLIMEAFTAVIDAFRDGSNTEAGVLFVVFLVAAIRKFAAPRYTWLNDDPAASGLVLVAAFASALAVGLADEVAITGAYLWATFKIAAYAAGGYSLIKHTVGYALDRIPMPSWLRTGLRAALILFTKPGEEADAKAAAAGEKALKDTPPAGRGETARWPNE